MTLALACGGSLATAGGRPVPVAPLDGVAAFFAVSAVFPQSEDTLRLTLLRILHAHRHAIQTRLLRAARRFPALPLPLFCYLSSRRLLAGHGAIDLPLTGRRLTYPLGLLADLLALHVDETTSKPFFLLGARNDALFTPAMLRATYERLDAPEKKLHFSPVRRGTCSHAGRNGAGTAAYLALRACAQGCRCNAAMLQRLNMDFSVYW